MTKSPRLNQARVAFHVAAQPRRISSRPRLTGPPIPPMPVPRPWACALRLKSSFNISTFSAANQVILKALQQYGMIMADNGSSMYLGGAPDSQLGQQRSARSRRRQSFRFRSRKDGHHLHFRESAAGPGARHSEFHRESVRLGARRHACNPELVCHQRFLCHRFAASGGRARKQRKRHAERHHHLHAVRHKRIWTHHRHRYRHGSVALVFFILGRCGSTLFFQALKVCTQLRQNFFPRSLYLLQ